MPRAPLGIAVAVALPGGDVVGQLLVVERGALAADRGVRLLGVAAQVDVVHERDEPGERRFGRHRGFRVKDGWQWLGVDRDEADGVLGDRLGLGDDHRDRLPREHGLAARQRLEHPHVVAMADGQVGGREHGDHAGQRESL